MSEVHEILQELEDIYQKHPVALPILTIHRGDDGYIAFARKPGASSAQPGKSWENLFSIRTEELETMFPEIRDWLIQDAYFSVNGMFRPAHTKHKGSGLPGVLRSENNLRYLNACYVDLDVGRPDGTAVQQRTWRDAAAAVGNLMDQGVLPPASIFARSGQGLYVYWLLHAEKSPQEPPHYWPEKLALYKQINQHIGQLLKDQAADLGAFDGARVLRVPGTLHTKAGRHAIYLVQLDSEGRIPKPNAPPK